MRRLSVIQLVSPPRPSANGNTGITGPERRASNLAGQWRSRGVEVTIFYPRRGALWSKFEASGCPIVDFELHGKWDWRAVPYLVREIRQRGVHVIHSQGSPAVDLIAVIAARLGGAKAVITRPVMIEDQIDRSSRSLALFDAVDRRLTLPGSAAVVAVSRDGLRRLRERMSPEKVCLIHNGVRAFPTRQFASAAERRPANIGMVGHLLSYKGWFDFFDVAACLTREGVEAVWHVVGEGPERQALEAYAAKLGLADRTRFHGLLQDVSPVLLSLDLFLFTSHREGLSVAVLEAMSVGLPIVATEVAGIRDQVVDNENGFVLPVGDIATMAAKVRNILDDDDLRRAMSLRSRERMENLFSEAAMLDGYVETYCSVSEIGEKS